MIFRTLVSRVTACARRTTALFLAATLVGTSFGCDAGDLLDLALDPPKRKPIDTSITGVNAFFVNDGFGTIDEQYSDIKNVLRLKYVRVLLAWTDGVQPTPTSRLNFSFYDQILNRIPQGVEVNIVLAHTPSWMSNSANWIDGNPRTTFAQKWVREAAARYSVNGRVTSIEIGNEPDLLTVPSDASLGLEDPANYLELLSKSAAEVRRHAPGKLVVMAATQSIQQNFPVNLRYNQKLRELGVENFIDVYNFHFYGTSYESVVTQNGAADFLNSIGKPIWLTESGAQGPNNQLAYVEEAWPFLKEKIPAIDRIYYYEYTSSFPAPQSYGLRLVDPVTPVSDLYIFLRDRP